MRSCMVTTGCFPDLDVNSIRRMLGDLRLWVLALLLAVLSVHCRRSCRVCLVPDCTLLLDSLHWLGLFTRSREVICTSLGSCRLLEPRVVHCIILGLALILSLLASGAHVDNLHGLTNIEIGLDHHAVHFAA